MISIDIVIPTNGSPVKLQSILELEPPEGITLDFFIVVDAGSAFPDAKNVRIRVVESKGVGASDARNAGMEAGSGDYILFLDDDIAPLSSLLESYQEAIAEKPDSPGFVGLTKLPAPQNSFERGVVASDILTFQGIAATHPVVSWGVTANLMLRRDAVGSIRFSPDFPRHGGGEDIDFCLKIVKQTGSRLVSVPEATVNHPWWGNGSRQYKRFARWAYGDSRLPAIYPEYRYRNLPNMAEAALLTAIVFAMATLLSSRLILGCGYSFLAAFLSEWAIDWFNCARRGTNSPITGMESALVRLSNEFGRIAGNLSRGHLAGLFERFDYFTTGESISYERKMAGAKLLAFIAILSAFLLF